MYGMDFPPSAMRWWETAGFGAGGIGGAGASFPAGAFGAGPVSGTACCARSGAAENAAAAARAAAIRTRPEVMDSPFGSAPGIIRVRRFRVFPPARAESHAEIKTARFRSARAYRFALERP